MTLGTAQMVVLRALFFFPKALSTAGVPTRNRTAMDDGLSQTLQAA
jgi:hypothetical protein